MLQRPDVRPARGASVLIVDDEAPARDRLARLVAEVPGFHVAGACGTGVEALALVSKLAPAVVLLDVRMPGMTGLEAARHLAALAEPPAVVFTTAYDEHALEAFETRAVDYLVKPVRRERLAAALVHAARSSARRLRELALASEPPVARRNIAVQVRDKLVLVAVADIRYFRADEKYVVVRHAGGELLIDDPLRALEQEFADQFVRAHRSLLVAVAHVEALERTVGGGYALRLRGETERLPVSRRLLGELRRRLAPRS